MGLLRDVSKVIRQSLVRFVKLGKFSGSMDRSAKDVGGENSFHGFQANCHSICGNAEKIGLPPDHCSRLSKVRQAANNSPNVS